jgi:hypothetical protein
MKKHLFALFVLAVFVLLLQNKNYAQGTWKTVTNSAPNGNGGVMLLLTDGTVMALSEDSAKTTGTYGNIWNLLTPDVHGSYQNGTWSTLPAMHNTRLYCSSQVMPNGNVFVAGGEYGSGGSTAEVYNTSTKTWTLVAGGIPKNWVLDDANSKMLANGTILEAVVESNASASSSTLIYSPITNSFTSGPSLLGSSDEASWTTLPDGSIMNVDICTENSERYIPQQKKWIKDANLPVYLYDYLLGESGVGLLLPNGNLFFLGDSIYTAIYAPTGSTTVGAWTQGPAMPKISGVQYACPDAPAAMMVNGTILCAFSPAGTYNTPTYFYEYNYLTNAFTQVGAPGGATKLTNTATYFTTMLDLPDGTVLFSQQGSKSYYQYTPSGSPLAVGTPTISAIIPNCPGFTITGTLFNGISEGASYGDDWQMATNYPIVRLTDGTNVYYGRTTNWNRVGAVMTGSLADTASFTIPTMPAGTYSVQVVANGIASASYTLSLPCVQATGIQAALSNNAIRVYPNPNNGIFTLESSFPMDRSVVSIYNMLGEQVEAEKVLSDAKSELDLSGQAAGVYYYRVFSNNGALLANGKLVIQK